MTRPISQKLTMVVPAIAHRRRDVFRMDGSSAENLEDLGYISPNAYNQYVFLGRIPAPEFQTRHEARTAAREKFHPEARVFRTARYYIAYRVL